MAIDTRTRRRLLTDLLLGFDEFSFTDSLVTPQFEEGEERARGIWFRPLRYISKDYPTSEVDEEGEVFIGSKREVITAYLLVPQQQNGRGVVALHQHAGEFDLGKSEPAGVRVGKKGPAFAYGLELAQRGYTVVCFDFKTFENRQYDHENLQRGWGESYFKQECLLSGIEPMGIAVLDTMRAVDVLQQEGIEEIGIIGHSMGGTVVPYAMALDDRITAGVANCGIATLDSVQKSPKVQGCHWSVANMLGQFGELHQLLALTGDRPIFISAGESDPSLPIAGARQFIEWGRAVGGNPLLYSFKGGHEFPEEVRSISYEFMNENLGVKKT